MKKNLSVHFSSASDNWATPQWLFDELNKKYGPFNLDVCASEENTKCVVHFGQIALDLFISGLDVGWATWFDSITQKSQVKLRCWMNPPYGRTIGLWIKKAYEESLKGCRVVCLLPARMDTKWFHDYIYNKPNVTIEFLKGRLKFGDAKNSAPFPSMVVVFDPPK